MNQPSTLKERILQYAQVHLGAEPGWGWNGRSPSTFSM